MSDIVPVDELVKSAMYRVRIKIPGVYPVERESCMRLIDVLHDDYAGVVLVFSARPKLGTQTVNMRHVTLLEREPDDAQVYVAWKVTSKTPPQKWDYAR